MLKILIIEDDRLYANELLKNLEEFDCKVVGIARSEHEALKLYETYQPDFLMVDIELHGKKTGVDVMHTILREARLPFLFLSQYYEDDDKNYRQSALEVQPYNYLPKLGYNGAQIWHFIQMAMSGYAQESGIFHEDTSGYFQIRNHIFLKNGNQNKFYRYSLDEILSIETRRPYVHLYVSGRTHILNTSLSKLKKKLRSNELIPISQSEIVNVRIIQTFDKKSGHILTTDGRELKVSRRYKAEMLKRIELLK